MDMIVQENSCVPDDSLEEKRARLRTAAAVTIDLKITVLCLRKHT